MLDRAELQHNHEPQSLDFFQLQQMKEITEAQRHFISQLFRKNPKVNGAEVRRIYRKTHPNEPDMFGKKV